MVANSFFGDCNILLNLSKNLNPFFSNRFKSIFCNEKKATSAPDIIAEDISRTNNTKNCKAAYRSIESNEIKGSGSNELNLVKMANHRHLHFLEQKMMFFLVIVSFDLQTN